MENQGDEVNSQNNHQFQTISDVERFLSLEMEPSLNQEMNESAEEELNDVSSRKKGRWSIEEDRKLLSLVKKHGAGKWAKISSEMDGRARKNCSARWNNHLRPDIKKKDKWSEEEEKLFIEAHQTFGNKWAKIAKLFPGRSENSIKNHWHTAKRKQILKDKKMKQVNEANEAKVLREYIHRDILNEHSPPIEGSSEPQRVDENQLFYDAVSGSNKRNPIYGLGSSQDILYEPSSIAVSSYGSTSFQPNVEEYQKLQEELQKMKDQIKEMDEMKRQMQEMDEMKQQMQELKSRLAIIFTNWN